MAGLVTRPWRALLMCAATPLLLVPSTAAAQRWRFGLGPAGGYSIWSPVLSPTGGGAVTFEPSWLAGADATFWLSPSLGLRASGSFAQPDLVLRRGATTTSRFLSSVQTMTGSAELLIPFGARPKHLLRTRALPYIALGVGATMFDPRSTSCPVTGGEASCGSAFTVDGNQYMLERKLEPSAIAALGMDIGLGPAAALRLELGDRASRSPVIPLVTDASGDVAAGEPQPMVVHRAYASVGLQLHSRYIWNRGRDTTKGVPLVAASVGGGSAPLIKEKATRPGDLTVATVLDGLGAGKQSANPKPLPVKRVAPVTPVDSTRPRPIGSDGFYDVVLDIPNLSVDEITLEVNNIHAHVSLNARVAKLVELNVGADAGIDRVYLGIRGVQAEAHLKVDLDNVASIVDRVLTTIDRNPEIITGLLETIDNTVSTVGSVANTALAPNGVVAQTVGTVGQIANTALQPGGVVSDLVTTVGNVANTALAPNGVIAQTVGTIGGVANTALQPGGVVSQTVQTVGDVANNAVNTVGGVANTALQPGGVVSQTLTTVGDVANNTVNTVGGVANTAIQPGGVVSQVTGAVGGAVQNLTGQGGLLSAQTLNALGQTLVRVVDATGQIYQRTLDASGKVLAQNLVGTVLQLPTVSQTVGANGVLQRVVRDVSGRQILVLLDNVGRILGTQVLQQAAGAAGAIAPAVVPVPNLQPNDDDVMQQGAVHSWRHMHAPGPSIKEEEVAAHFAMLQQSPIDSVPKHILLAATIDDKGEMVQRIIDATGTIYERTIEPRDGTLTMEKSVGTVLRLPLVSQRMDSVTNAIVRTVREPSTNAIVELTFSQVGRLERIRLLQMGQLPSATMATAAVTANRSPASPPPTAMPGTLAAPAPLAPNALPAGALPVEYAQPAALAQPTTASAKPAPSASNALPGVSIQSGLDALGRDPQAADGSTAPIDPDTTKQLLLLSQRTNERGQIVLRVVDLDGKITERSLNASGQLIVRKGAVNARLLPLIREYVDNSGKYVRLVKDVLGAVLELDFNDKGKLYRVRVLQRPDLDVTGGAAAAAASLPSAVSQTVNSLGQTVQHMVVTTGSVVERVIDKAGRVVGQREVGSVFKLPALLAVPQADGRVVVIAHDPTGILLEVVMRAADRAVMSVKAIDIPSATR